MPWSSETRPRLASSNLSNPAFSSSNRPSALVPASAMRKLPSVARLSVTETSSSKKGRERVPAIAEPVMAF